MTTYFWMPSVNETDLSGESPMPEHDSALSAITTGMVEGRQTDFTRFCQLYSNALHRYCLKVVKGDEAESYELHQQVLIRIARSPKPFSDERSLWRWMSRIVRTTLIDMHRKRKRYGDAMHAYWEHLTNQSKNLQQHDSVLSATLLEVLGEMPEIDRELLEKKYLGGWSYQALADHLDLSAKAVESRLTRARIRLRERALQRMETDAKL